MDYDWGDEDELLAEFHAAGIYLPRELEELKRAAEMRAFLGNQAMQLQGSLYAQQAFCQQQFLNQQHQYQGDGLSQSLGAALGLGFLGR